MPRQAPKRHPTLFPRLIRDARDKAVMQVSANGPTTLPSSNPRLISSDARRGVGNNCISFAYKHFEGAFLEWTMGLTMDDMLPSRKGSTVAANILDMQLKLEDLNECIRTLNTKIDGHRNCATVVDEIADWNQQCGALTDTLKRLQSPIMSNMEAVLQDTKKLVEALHQVQGRELNRIRLRLRANIAQLVESIWVLVYDMEVSCVNPRRGTKRQRVADVQVFFQGGGIRHLCILSGPNTHQVFTEPTGEVPKEQDLRTYNEETYRPLGKSAVQVLYGPPDRDFKEDAAPLRHASDKTPRHNRH